MIFFRHNLKLKLFLESLEIRIDCSDDIRITEGRGTNQYNNMKAFTNNSKYEITNANGQCN